MKTLDMDAYFEVEWNSAFIKLKVLKTYLSTRPSPNLKVVPLYILE